MLVLAVAAISGCGNAGVDEPGLNEPGVESRATDGQPSTVHYSGPLYVPRDEAEHPQAGAAGDVVDCGAWGNGGFSDRGVYDEGATADSPEQALEVARSEGIFSGVREGLRDVKTEENRVLYVLEVDRVIKQAVIVRHGPATEGAVERHMRAAPRTVAAAT